VIRVQAKRRFGLGNLLGTGVWIYQQTKILMRRDFIDLCSCTGSII
jgi:hypothetical protein